MISQNYNWLTNIASKKFEHNSIILIGTGYMASEYAAAFKKMKISDVNIISKNDHEIFDSSNFLDFNILYGGYEKILPTLKPADLIIIATPIPLLLDAANIAVKTGQKNILIEKPGSLYTKNLKLFSQKLTDQKIRIGYNRLTYPSFHKLKLLAELDGGITSCTFNLTEWIHKIKFKTNLPEVYARWGISNSLHVISMAFELIGMPKSLTSYHNGSLDWHTSGSIFTGSGLSVNDIPFSYHGNWESGGRWGIDLMTKESIYRLTPLEELYECKKGEMEWKKIPIKTAFPDVKTGIAEEIAMMLSDSIEKEIGLTDLEKAIQYNEIAEKIFNY